MTAAVALQPRAWTTVAVLALSVTWLAAPAAHAAPTDGLEVSSDGSRFARTTDASLFENLGRVVPGSRGQDSVWFRNSTDLTVKLRLQLSDGWTESTPLANATTLTIDGLGTPLSTPLGAPLASGACAVVSRDYLLKPGKTVRVDAKVSVSTSLTDRQGALKSLGFALKAFAADASVDLPATCATSTPNTAGPTTPPTAPPPTDPTVKPPLANTGFGTGVLAAIGAAAASLGFVLARRRGKRSA